MFENLQNLFFNKHGNYAKNFQFEVLFIMLLIIAFFTYYFKNSYGFIIILIVFTFFIIENYIIIKNTKVTDFNNITSLKLNTLQSKTYEYINTKLSIISNQSKQKLSNADTQKIYKNNKLDSLYIDANIIHFLYSILPLYEYNNYEFFELLKGTNNILKLRNEIETYFESNGEYPINTSEIFEEALRLRSNTINNVHNFIYSVPKVNKMYSYLNDIIDRYSILISRNTDFIDKYYKENLKLRGITASTKIVSYNTTKPFDALSNHSLNPQLNHTKNNQLSFYI